MTDFLQGLIHDDHKLNPVIIKNGWLEIDSLKDYELYNRMNANGNLQKFISFEVKTSIRELVGALNRIISFSRVYNKVPSLVETKIILKDLLNIS